VVESQAKIWKDVGKNETERLVNEGVRSFLLGGSDNTVEVGEKGFQEATLHNLQKVVMRRTKWGGVHSCRLEKRNRVLGCGVSWKIRGTCGEAGDAFDLGCAYSNPCRYTLIVKEGGNGAASNHLKNCKADCWEGLLTWKNREQTTE